MLQSMMNRWVYFFCLFALIAVPFSMNAQKLKPQDFGIKSKKALKFYEEGLQQAQWRAREQAIAAFKEAIKIEPDFAHAHYQVGVNAYVKKKYEDALTHLEKAYELRPTDFRAINFYLGETYFWNAKYAEAIPLLESFIKEEAGRKVDLVKAAKDLRHARFAAEGVKNPVSFTPVNMGSAINTERDEYLPYLTADDSYLLFTSRRPQSVGGFNRSLQDYSEDFFFSERENDTWTEAKNLGMPINTRENEGAASITQDGRTIFFTACNLPGGIGNCDLYYSFKEGSKWSRPQNMGPAVNSEGWDSQPCLSGDGKTLYFASVRKGSIGGRDIWYSKKVDGQWTQAQSLGAPINTIGNEDSPFLHADGMSMYFSSDFHPGFGSQDLFVSYLSPEGEWGEPVNLGYPLNTIADESNIFVNTSGERGFINSDREGGFGRSDLYEFQMDERIRPQIATFLRGTLRDSITGTPVYGNIRLMDVESGDTIREIFSNKANGKFLMSLPLEREYAALVEAKGYLFVSRHFYLKDMAEKTYFDLIIEMPPIKKGVQVVLRNIFFESGSFELKETSRTELDFMTYFMKQYPRLKIEIQGHTDDVGTDSNNLTLSQKRADSVRAFLVEHGIEAERIVAKGYGESMPVAGNITDEDRAQNRRTEFKILELE